MTLNKHFFVPSFVDAGIADGTPPKAPAERRSLAPASKTQEGDEARDA